MSEAAPPAAPTPPPASSSATPIPSTPPAHTRSPPLLSPNPRPSTSPSPILRPRNPFPVDEPASGVALAAALGDEHGRDTGVPNHDAPVTPKPVSTSVADSASLGPSHDAGTPTTSTPTPTPAAAHVHPPSITLPLPALQALAGFTDLTHFPAVSFHPREGGRDTVIHRGVPVPARERKVNTNANSNTNTGDDDDVFGRRLSGISTLSLGQSGGGGSGTHDAGLFAALGLADAAATGTSASGVPCAAPSAEGAGASASASAGVVGAEAGANASASPWPAHLPPPLFGADLAAHLIRSLATAPIAGSTPLSPCCSPRRPPEAWWAWGVPSIRAAAWEALYPPSGEDVDEMMLDDDEGEDARALLRQQLLQEHDVADGKDKERENAGSDEPSDEPSDTPRPTTRPSTPSAFSISAFTDERDGDDDDDDLPLVWTGGGSFTIPRRAAHFSFCPPFSPAEAELLKTLVAPALRSEHHHRRQSTYSTYSASASTYSTSARPDAERGRNRERHHSLHGHYDGHRTPSPSPTRFALPCPVDADHSGPSLPDVPQPIWIPLADENDPKQARRTSASWCSSWNGSPRTTTSSPARTPPFNAGTGMAAYPFPGAAQASTASTSGPAPESSADGQAQASSVAVAAAPAAASSPTPARPASAVTVLPRSTFSRTSLTPAPTTSTPTPAASTPATSTPAPPASTSPVSSPPLTPALSLAPIISLLSLDGRKDTTTSTTKDKDAKDTNKEPKEKEEHHEERQRRGTLSGMGLFLSPRKKKQGAA